MNLTHENKPNSLNSTNNAEKVSFYINGSGCFAPKGSSIISVADLNQVYIPRFCYHTELSVVASCRMCLVEIEGLPKLVPACATPIAAGMKVLTDTSTVKSARRDVLEFLLANHPLDCPVCDQGGECELQDLTKIYANDRTEFYFNKNTFVSDDFGPLITTEMNRCINCTRCVRYMSEVAGYTEVGLVDRADKSKITGSIKVGSKSGLSGNMIDICPVGAIVSKPYLFSERAWHLKSNDGISMHDCVGSNLSIHTPLGENSVARIVPRKNTEINNIWLSDRDRFSYLALKSTDRLLDPMIRNKETGILEKVSWDFALDYTIDKLKEIVLKYGADKLGGIINPSSTVEEMYLFQSLLRIIGSDNVDHRVRQHDTSYDSAIKFPVFGTNFKDIETQDVIFLIGSDIQNEAPILAQNLRKAVKNGAKVISLNVCDYDYNFDTAFKIIKPIKKWSQVFENINSSDHDYSLINKLLQESKNKLIILGEIAGNNFFASKIRYLAHTLSKKTDSNFGVITSGSNSVGAWIAGCLPYRKPFDFNNKISNGFDLNQMLNIKMKSYALFSVEPMDFIDPKLFIDAISKSEFNLIFSSFMCDEYKKYGDVFLPIAAFGENEGTYVNAEMRWQTFENAIRLQAQSKFGWDVLNALRYRYDLNSGYDRVKSVNDLRTEFFALKKSELPKLNECFDYSDKNHQNYKSEGKDIDVNSSLESLNFFSMYDIDAYTRRVECFDKIDEKISENCIYINESLAKQFNLNHNDEAIVTIDAADRFLVRVLIDNKLADDVIKADRNFLSFKYLHSNQIKISGLV